MTFDPLFAATAALLFLPSFDVPITIPRRAESARTFR